MKIAIEFPKGLTIQSSGKEGIPPQFITTIESPTRIYIDSDTAEIDIEIKCLKVGE